MAEMKPWLTDDQRETLLNLLAFLFVVCVMLPILVLVVYDLLTW